MSGNFNISRPIGGGYIVGETTVRKLARLCEAFSGKAPEISLTFQDGRNIKSTNPDNVFNDSFIQANRIFEIKISYDNDFSVTHRSAVEFRKHDSYPIIFNANGERQSVLVLEHDVMNVIVSIRTWYNTIVFSKYTTSNNNAVHVISFIVVICAFIFVVLSHYHFNYLYSLFSSKNYLLFLAIFLIYTCFYYAFPSMVFDIGEDARRQRRRTALWSLFMLVIVAGIAVTLFTDWLKTLF
jgi:hypothetical protein